MFIVRHLLTVFADTVQTSLIMQQRLNINHNVMEAKENIEFKLGHYVHSLRPFQYVPNFNGEHEGHHDKIKDTSGNLYNS